MFRSSRVRRWVAGVRSLVDTNLQRRGFLPVPREQRFALAFGGGPGLLPYQGKWDYLRLGCCPGLVGDLLALGCWLVTGQGVRFHRLYMGLTRGSLIYQLCRHQ